MEIVTIVVLAIICIALIIWISTTIIASLTIIRKLRARIKRHKSVNTYQHNHIADLTKVIADQIKEIRELTFVCMADDDIIEVLEKEIEEKEKVIKLLTPTEIDGN